MSVYNLPTYGKFVVNSILLEVLRAVLSFIERLSSVDCVQWNPSIVATIGERNFVLYRGVALSQGLICTKRVYLGLSEVVFIEGCPHIWGVHCTFELKDVALKGLVRPLLYSHYSASRAS